MESTKLIDLKFMPTLRHLTLFRVTLTIYNSEISPFQPLKILKPSVVSPIQNYERLREDLLLRVTFIEKIHALKLPRQIRQELWDYFRSINTQTYSWIFHFVKRFMSGPPYFSPKCLLIIFQNIVWTGSGTIDFQKTIEVFLKLKFLPKEMRFSLAAEYCMDRYIPLLYQQIMANKRLEELSTFNPLAQFWASHENGNLDNWIQLRNWKSEPTLSSAFQVAFLAAMSCNNITAMWYFHPKVIEAIGESLAEKFFFNCTKIILSSEIHQKSFKIIGHRFSDNVCFLLNIMTKDKQEYFLKNYSDVIFLCFFDWPYNVYVADLIYFCTRNSIYPGDIRAVFYNWVSSDARLNSGNFYSSKQSYQEMFAQCWRSLPEEFKRSAQNHGNSSSSAGLFKTNTAVNGNFGSPAKRIQNKDYKKQNCSSYKSY